ncbi:hypothetical protein, partial [Actinotalea ferrariae]|uniref:hypothetical protein n=1 Tax=Actinotalea ferrariae TaxID=1386098 RepID=UPI0005538B85
PGRVDDAAPGPDTGAPATRPSPAVGTVRPPDAEHASDDGLLDEHRSPYTWWQVLGLVTVAFVLGVLIYFALVQGADAGAGAGAAAPFLMDLSIPGASSPSSPFETGA